MGSDANKMSDATSFQPSEPALCANGCGFFGSAATMNLCSKCFRDQRIKSEQTVSAKTAMEKLVSKVASLPILSTSSSSSSSETVSQRMTAVAEKMTASNRCVRCTKKVGVMGFKCRCGETFCGSHRYPEEHECEFDFKRTGKEAIARANPVVKADKVNRI